MKAAWLKFRRGGFVFAVLIASALYLIAHFALGLDPDFGGYNLLLSIDASVMGAWLLDLMLRMSEQDRAQFQRIEESEARIEASETRIESLEQQIATWLGGPGPG